MEGNKMHGESATGSYRTYIAGFILSLSLTLVAYVIVSQHLLNRGTIAAIICLAVVQLFVQLVFFLHLGRESKPRWNLAVFSMAAIVVLILVLGSLWIMNHLNYNMNPERVKQYLQSQDGL